MYICIFVFVYTLLVQIAGVYVSSIIQLTSKGQVLSFYIMSVSMYVCMYVSMGAGTGPVDAAYKAIGELTSEGSSEIKLLEYTVSSVTAGIDALGEVTVRLQDLTNNRTGVGRLGHSGCMYKLYLTYMCEHIHTFITGFHCNVN